jgi:hypothetical protein
MNSHLMLFACYNAYSIASAMPNQPCMYMYYVNVDCLVDHQSEIPIKSNKVLQGLIEIGAFEPVTAVHQSAASLRRGTGALETRLASGRTPRDNDETEAASSLNMPSGWSTSVPKIDSSTYSDIFSRHEEKKKKVFVD